MPTANSRATPSGFMMNGFIPASGGESALKSGTSVPPQLLPFHHTRRFFTGSHGWPDGSAEARL
ncbi:hypothetical protein D3C80_1552960 [compost metagenome]